MKISLKKNYIYNLLYQFINVLAPLILTPYLSRTLGAESLGIYGYTYSIVSYFILFGCFGINLYGQREIAICRNNEKRKSKIFIELLLLKIIFISISAIFFVIIFCKESELSLYYKILVIELISNVFDINWFYQGLENFKKITIRNIFVKLVSIISIMLLIKNSNDLYKYFFIKCVSDLIGYSILWFDLKKFINLRKIDEINIFKHIVPNLQLFIPQIAIQIYAVLDKTMIGKILGEMVQVGYYEQSQKVVRTILTIITSLGIVMLPRISNLYADKKNDELKNNIVKSFNFVSLLVYPMCFGLLGISDKFVPWFFGENYSDVILLLEIFSFMIIPVGFNDVIGNQYLIPTKNQKKYTISILIGTVSNFILNSVLIIKYKCYGAAIASVVAEYIIFSVQFYYMNKFIYLKKIFLSNLKYLIYSIIMFVSIKIIGYFFNSSIFLTSFQILFGMSIYLLLLIVFKDNIFNNTLKLLLLKLKNKTLQKKKC